MSGRLSVVPPGCGSPLELHALLSTRSVMEGFVSFCALKGLSSRSTSVYIDGLKFYAVGLGGAPIIPGSLAIAGRDA